MINTRNTLGTTHHTSRKSTLIGIGLSLLALAILVSNATAQEPDDGTSVQEFTVFGHVADAETGQALAGAWVGLPGTDWGSITDHEGRFRIPGMEAGRLALSIEMLGYETLAWAEAVNSAEEVVRIKLAPQPILLEGLEVMADRFRSRRNAVATSVFAYTAADLSTTAARTMLEFVETRTGAWFTACNGRRGSSCLVVRGRTVEPVIYVDEAPLLGGLDYLDSFAPWEFHMIEVYSGGSHIRLYTDRFMKRVAEHRVVPIPITSLGR